MKNTKYLKENGLMDAHKQFMRLCEYGYNPSTSLEEEGEDPSQDPNAMGGADPSMGGDPNAQGGADPSMGGDPNAQGGADPSMGSDPNAMGGADPSMGGDPNAMGGTDPSMGGDPNMMGDPNAMGGADPMADPSMGEDDQEMVSVEDLTQAQEKLNDKQNAIGKKVIQTNDKFDELSHVISKLEQMIDSNNKKIENLNKEFQARVKTPTEKLNLRALDSYPFNVDMCSEAERMATNPHYSVVADNEIPTTKEYSIYQSDIDNMNDKEVENSFIDDEFRQDLNKIFGL